MLNQDDTEVVPRRIMSEKKQFYDRKRPAHQVVADRFNTSLIIFLTVCTDKRTAILCSDKVHALLLESWRKADAWMVGRYIMMPGHIHLFCSPVGLEYPPLKKWANYWKSISASAWPDSIVGKVWQRDFWDTQLRRGENYFEKWQYVVNNPVRAGFVESPTEWPYQGELCGLQWHD